MIEDREIWACANLVLRRYGADAWFHAAQRADELLAEGEQDGHRTWLRILNRIEELERVQPSGALHDHRCAPVVPFGDEWSRWLDIAADVGDLLGPESRDRFVVTKCGIR